MQKLCLSMPQTEKIHAILFNKSNIEETKNNIAQFYLANPFWAVRIELKAMVSLSEPLTCTRLILFLRRQLLATLSIKILNQGLTTEANRTVIELALRRLNEQVDCSSR